MIRYSSHVISEEPHVIPKMLRMLWGHVLIYDSMTSKGINVEARGMYTIGMSVTLCNSYTQY